jgi:hypothetical protein
VLVLVVQNAVPYADLGVATGAAAFFRSMGGSFGVAVFGANLNTRMAEELPRLVPAAMLAEAGGGASRLLSSPEQIRLLLPAIIHGIIEALAPVSDTGQKKGGKRLGTALPAQSI